MVSPLENNAITSLLSPFEENGHGSCHFWGSCEPPLEEIVAEFFEMRNCKMSLIFSKASLRGNDGMIICPDIHQTESMNHE